MHCGKCSLELKLKGCRKTGRKLQLPRGDEAGLFPRLAVAPWEGVGTLSAYVGGKAGLGGKCGKPPEAPPPKADLVGGEVEGWRQAWRGEVRRTNRSPLLRRHKVLRDVAEARGSAVEKCAEAVADGKIQRVLCPAKASRLRGRRRRGTYR